MAMGQFVVRGEPEEELIVQASRGQAVIVDIDVAFPSRVVDFHVGDRIGQLGIDVGAEGYGGFYVARAELKRVRCPSNARPFCLSAS